MTERLAAAQALWAQRVSSSRSARTISIVDHAGNVAALGVLGALAAAKPTYTGSVVPLVG